MRQEAKLLFILSLLALAHADLSLDIMQKLASKQESPSNFNQKCDTNPGFLTTPYSVCFPVTPNTINTGPIAGLPACWQPRWIMGSVVKKTWTQDHINYLMGDIQDIGYDKNINARLTWLDADRGHDNRPDFGPKLVAATNQGDGDAVNTYHGVWEFTMIPLKSDLSFDIVPNGHNGPTSKICFNLIGYA